MLRITLIRHCETDWNKERRYLGNTDIHLNENGIKNAKILANFLKNENFTEIYSSELSRTYETASIIAEFHGLQIKKIKEFNEINFGKFEGLTFDEISEKFGQEVVERYLKDTLNFKFPNGESFRKFYVRVLKGINFILSKYNENDNILIVSHSGVNKIFLGKALEISFKKSFWRIKQDVGCINIINFFVPEKFAVVELINGKFI